MLKTAVQFISVEPEPMVIYQLADGTVVKCKCVLMHAERLDGQYMPDGQPMYNFAFQQVVYVQATEELKKGHEKISH